MKTIAWMCMAALLVSFAVGCGQKQGGHEMGGKSISTEKLDVAVFGKGTEAKFCPVSGTEIPAGKGFVYTLKDGRKIMLCCAACPAAVEKDPAKYKDFFY
jgi:ribosomal protein L24E